MPRKRIKTEDERAFHMKMPAETWMLLKKSSVIREMTMADIVVECIEKQRHRLTKKFTEITNFEDESDVEIEE